MPYWYPRLEIEWKHCGCSFVGKMINHQYHDDVIKWKKFSALLALCAGNSPVPGEFPAQRPVTRSFDVFFDLNPIKRLSKQSLRWWFETPSGSLCRHSNDHAVGVAPLAPSPNEMQKMITEKLVLCLNISFEISYKEERIIAFQTS